MANKKSLLSASSAAVDPTLDALFASSSGPVKAPSKSRYVDPPKPQDSPEASDDEDMEEDGEGDDLGSGEDDGSEASGNDEEDDDESPSTDNESEEAGGHAEATDDEDEEQAAAILEAVVDHSIAGDGGDRKRKRKKREEDGDDLESKYLQKLGDDGEPTGKRRKAEDGEPAQNDASAMEDHEMSGDDNTVPMHESLATSAPDNDVEKASRTVYLSNVSTEAIKSSKAKKILLTHLDSILDKEASPPQTIESIRFRSIPFATAGIPKRAAFIKKEVMDATTKAANAYVVFSDAAGCRAACSKLNGTVVLDRHLRVDSIAHPAVVDHRRCVFVGNLGFVDDESVLNTTLDEDGKEITEKRKRTKTPMDVEEGLWRVFSKDAGKVENVRVVRDPVTRVGKGFAYVQFYDGTSVEAALLLAGKRFPPMLPRELRVTRCRAPQKTARALGAKKQRTVITSRAKKNTDYVPKPTSESQTFAGRANKLLGRSAAFQAKGKQGKDRKVSRSRSESNGTGGRGGDADGHAIKTPEEIVFEGRRASAKDGKPKDLKFKGSKPSGQKKGPRRSHTTQRTQKWKAKQAGRK